MTHYISDDIYVTTHSFTSWSLTICETIYRMEEFDTVDALISAIRSARQFFTQSEIFQIRGYYHCLFAV
jgi:glutamate-1-semialdehyde aminotransferase